MYVHVAAGHLARDRIAEIKRTAEITAGSRRPWGTRPPNHTPRLFCRYGICSGDWPRADRSGGGLLRRAS